MGHITRSAVLKTTEGILMPYSVVTLQERLAQDVDHSERPDSNSKTS